MRVSVEEVFETVQMTMDHKFDIRTVTLGINLKDCMDRKLSDFNKRVYDRIVEMGSKLTAFADELEDKYGIPIINRRISITPASILLEPLPKNKATVVSFAKTLDRAAKKAGIDFIGGFGALMQKGMTASDENLLNAIPKALSQTDRVCSFFNLATTLAGMNMTAIERVGHVMKELAECTENV